MTGSKKNRILQTFFVIIGIIILIFPLTSDPYTRIIGRNVFVYLVLALSWDMLIRSGQLSFG